MSIGYVPKYKTVTGGGFLASDLTRVSDCHEYNFASFTRKINIFQSKRKLEICRMW